MNRRMFLALCNLIESKVGANEFKSERYLETLADQNSPLGRMSRANDSTSSGYVCGEVKVAITLRLLGGGSYLDLFVIYNIFQTHAYRIFHATLSNWIYNDEIFNLYSKWRTVFE